MEMAITNYNKFENLINKFTHIYVCKFIYMGLFEDYEQYLSKYQKIYGNKTIILYQNGSFMEVYGIDNEIEKVGFVREISDMLNIQLTRRNKSNAENDRSNFLLAGFPLNQLDRHSITLTEEYGYVVVIVEQVTPPPNPKRDVTNIISPSTNIKYIKQSTGNYLVSIYIESEGQKINQVKPINMVTIGLSAIDVSTGHNVVYETENLVDDDNLALDETYRFIQTLQPREIIINSYQANTELISKLDIGNILTHTNYQKEDIPPEYRKLSYQNEFLGNIFRNCGMLKPIEYINLEHHPTAIISYILLLNFCYKQKETLIDHINHPQIWNSLNYMVLDNNCINQLNITSGGGQKYSSVFNLIDHTSTSMGKRLLKEKLLLPLIDKQQIINRYNCLDFFRTEIDGDKLCLKHITGHQKFYLFQKYEQHLKNVVDIERLHRKISMNIMQPCEFNQLHTAYQEVVTITGLMRKDDSSVIIQNIGVCPCLDNYIKYYTDVLNLDETIKYNMTNITSSFFKKGYNSEIDGMCDQMTEFVQYFEQLSSIMSNYIAPKSEKPVVAYECSDDMGYHLELTTARWSTFDHKCFTPITFEIGQTLYTINKESFNVIRNRTGKTCKITSIEMKTISDKYRSVREILQKKICDVYIKFLSQLYEQFNGVMKDTVTFVSYVDMYKSNAKTSLLYNYCRPEFDEQPSPPSSVTRSYVNIEQLRHPLIERIQDNCQYVPQDIHFDEEHLGVLLFGVNCSGKSSLMKAIGIAIIMAQAGMYVPAKKFTYNPYHKILTRIVGNDNLFKGMSSFAVEMSELRGILKRANHNSIVLGDEICHGTETISAVSLVASAIITLSNIGSNFLFATHLHQLSQMDRITKLSNVKMYHLKVKYNENTGDLIYDRRLENGSGHPIYGLEVAKAMDLDRKFIDLANDIRREIMGIDEVIPVNKSKYNAQVYVNKCSIPNCTNDAVATHHIHFRSEADDTGYIDHVQKNHKSNLLPLCQFCHDRIHNDSPDTDRLIIKGYKMTSNGPILDYNIVRNPPKDNKKKLKLKRQ